MRTILLVSLIAHAAGCTDQNAGDAQQGGGGQQGTSAPGSGQGETVFTNGADPNNPFFAQLGTNGRTCATCHDQASGWSVTPTALQVRFDSTSGTDPIFRPVDGATSPNDDVSTLAARDTAYDLLLTKGLIRVGESVPANAEFTLADVTDPYGFASAAELSLFRRPLPATNLRFLSQIMWDTREPSLSQQATDATLGHAQAGSITSADAIAAIVAFESSTYSAQRIDAVAGDLTTNGASGGAQALVALAFDVGLNDSQSVGFDRRVFTLYDAWANSDTSTAAGQRRASIARGEAIFNTQQFQIRGVAGLPDQQGTCSTCHDTPNVGNHSLGAPMNIGVADPAQATPGLPRYTLQNTTSSAIVTTTDPGYALVTGRWADVGKFKVPVLRGLAVRAPYFHNGLANDLDEVVQFYTRRFQMRLDPGDRNDLVNFLSAL